MRNLYYFVFNPIFFLINGPNGNCFSAVGYKGFSAVGCKVFSIVGYGGFSIIFFVGSNVIGLGNCFPSSFGFLINSVFFDLSLN